MPGQNRVVKMKRIEHRENIVSQPLCAITRFCMAGSTISAAGYAINVTQTRQLQGKVIENVGRVPRAGQQDECAARAAPVEHLELDALVNLDKLDPVRDRKSVAEG